MGIKRILAIALVTVLVLNMNFTVFAADSSSTRHHSEHEEETTTDHGEEHQTTSRMKAVSQAKPGDEVIPTSVDVVVSSGDGKVSKVSLESYEKTAETAVSEVLTTAPAAIKTLLTITPSQKFLSTITAIKAAGNTPKVVALGTYKTNASAVDTMGNTIAAIKNTAPVGAFVMLLGVSADGSAQFSEAFVDPVTGNLLGIFNMTPMTISILAIG